MSLAKLILGCSVFLVASGGLVVSGFVVDATIPPKMSHKAMAAAQQTTAKIESAPASDTRNAGGSGEGPRPLGRWCVNLDGKMFGWDWPNIPFGAIKCEDGR